MSLFRPHPTSCLCLDLSLFLSSFLSFSLSFLPLSLFVFIHVPRLSPDWSFHLMASYLFSCNQQLCQLVGPQKFSSLWLFCPRRLKFGVKVKCACACVCVREGVCLYSCQLAKRGRGNGSGLLQVGTSKTVNINTGSPTVHCANGVRWYIHLPSSKWAESRLPWRQLGTTTPLPRLEVL